MVFKYFQKFLLIAVCQFLVVNFAGAQAEDYYTSVLPQPVGQQYAMTYNERHEFLVINNNDGSIRGGAYNISPYGGVYVANLHTISRSHFFEINKDYFRFYVFRYVPENFGYDYTTNFENLNTDSLKYRSRQMDLVIMINRHQYPEGRKDLLIQQLFRTLSSRVLRPNGIGYAFNGIVRSKDGYSEFKIRTNLGQLKINVQNKKLYLGMNADQSSLAEGSSGTLVVGRTSDVYKMVNDDEDGAESQTIPVGILKCRAVQNLPRNSNVLYEIQTFDFLMDSRYWIEEMQATPEGLFENDCHQLNGRGHGGA